MAERFQHLLALQKVSSQILCFVIHPVKSPPLFNNGSGTSTLLRAIPRVICDHACIVGYPPGVQIRFGRQRRAPNLSSSRPNPGTPEKVCLLRDAAAAVAENVTRGVELMVMCKDRASFGCLEELAKCYFYRTQAVRFRCQLGMGIGGQGSPAMGKIQHPCPISSGSKTR
jgi:hypothetical protein